MLYNDYMPKHLLLLEISTSVAQLDARISEAENRYPKYSEDFDRIIALKKTREQLVESLIIIDGGER